ncbi:hypothetical protein LguiB_022051 [Lonicera macranthoides]
MSQKGGTLSLRRPKRKVGVLLIFGNIAKKLEDTKSWGMEIAYNYAIKVIFLL